MDVLTRYGFTFEELNYMLESNDDINKLNESDIYEKIDILGKVGCMSDHIKNIFICNPYYLTRSSKDINKLIDKLYDVGLSNLFIIFDSNPYILNYSSKDIDDLVNLNRKKKINASDIVNYFNI